MCSSSRNSPVLQNSHSSRTLQALSIVFPRSSKAHVPPTAAPIHHLALLRKKGFPKKAARKKKGRRRKKEAAGRNQEVRLLCVGAACARPAKYTRRSAGALAQPVYRTRGPLFFPPWGLLIAARAAAAFSIAAALPFKAALRAARIFQFRHVTISNGFRLWLRARPGQARAWHRVKGSVSPRVFPAFPGRTEGCFCSRGARRDLGQPGQSRLASRACVRLLLRGYARACEMRRLRRNIASWRVYRMRMRGSFWKRSGGRGGYSRIFITSYVAVWFVFVRLAFWEFFISARSIFHPPMWKCRI